MTANTLISLLSPDNEDNILAKKGFNFANSPEVWKLILKAILKVKPG
jgi:hypothetical protein